LVAEELDPEISQPSSPPSGELLRIEVADDEDRYLPVSFDAHAPTRGLYAPVCGFIGSPPWEPISHFSDPASPWPVVPLFSAAERSAPAGMAVLRAQLEIQGAPALSHPASWAVLVVDIPRAAPAIGIADGRGLATVLFPYPEPVRMSIGSPRAPMTAGLVDQSWTLGLRVYFGRHSSPLAPLGAIAPRSGMPDLCDLLDQEPAIALADTAGTALTSVQLRYGHELIVRTMFPAPTPSVSASGLLIVPSV
jgi:hypothetical protein